VAFYGASFCLCGSAAVYFFQLTLKLFYFSIEKIKCCMRVDTKSVTEKATEGKGNAGNEEKF
jgi:hypothetical protein